MRDQHVADVVGMRERARHGCRPRLNCPDVAVAPRRAREEGERVARRSDGRIRRESAGADPCSESLALLLAQCAANRPDDAATSPRRRAACRPSAPVRRGRSSSQARAIASTGAPPRRLPVQPCRSWRTSTLPSRARGGSVSSRAGRGKSQSATPMIIIIPKPASSACACALRRYSEGTPPSSSRWMIIQAPIVRPAARKPTAVLMNRRTSENMPLPPPWRAASARHQMAQRKPSICWADSG